MTAVVFAFALLAGAAVPVSRADVSGVVVLEGTGAPVSGSLVTLLSEDGRVLALTVTDREGRFHLRGAAAPRVLVESIGRSDIEAPVPADGDVRIEVPAARIMLASATANSADACVPVTAMAGATRSVWAEVRKALRVDAWARANGVFAYDVFQYDRRLSDRERIEAERARVVDNVPDGPARTRPAEEINAQGFARATPRGDVLYAPDADVLLSGRFASTHCFGVRAGPAGRIGLTFEPAARREQVDIRGVMWVDATTAELRAIEFRYTGLAAGTGDGPGGVVEYARLPDGLWSVAKWAVRTPAPRNATERYREEGVEVLRVVRIDGTATPVVPRANLLGIVHESSGGALLEGAQIRLAGTDYIATTNADGRFFIPDLPPGRFRLTVSRADAKPPEAVSQDVLLSSRQSTHIDVNLAALQPIVVEENTHLSASDSVLLFLQSAGLNRSSRVDSLVTEAVDSRQLGRLVGRVFDRVSGKGIGGAEVRLPGTDLAAITSGDGRFLLGNVPSGKYVIETEMLGYRARADSVRVPPGLIIDASIALHTQPIELEPIRVTVLSRWLDSNGFFERRRGGLAGRFFTRAEIEKLRPAQFTDLLRDVPGVLIMTEEVGKTMVRFRRVTTIARAAEEERGCQPGVYYDGIPLNTGFDLLHSIPVPFIDGVEVYVGSATPIEYKNPCGVILIWTRRPR